MVVRIQKSHERLGEKNLSRGTGNFFFEEIGNINAEILTAWEKLLTFLHLYHEHIKKSENYNFERYAINILE